MNAGNIFSTGKSTPGLNQRPFNGKAPLPLDPAFQKLVNAALDRTLGNTGKSVYADEKPSESREKPQESKAESGKDKVWNGYRHKNRAGRTGDDSADGNGNAASAQTDSVHQAPAMSAAQTESVTDTHTSIPESSANQAAAVVNNYSSGTQTADVMPETGTIETQVAENSALQGGESPEQNAENTDIADQLNITDAEISQPGANPEAEIEQGDAVENIQELGTRENELFPEETDGFADLIEEATRKLDETVSQRNVDDQAKELRHQSHNTLFEEGLRREAAVHPARENDTFKPKSGTGESKTVKPGAMEESESAAQLSTTKAVSGGTPMQREDVAAKASSIPQQAEQIQAEIIRNLDNQRMEFRLQLQPENLGKIDVKMALEGGKLMVEIISSAKTSELLSRQTDALVASLRQNNPAVSSVQVVHETSNAGSATLGNFGESQNRQDNGSGHSGHAQHSNQNDSADGESDEYVSAKSDKVLDYVI